MKQKCSHQSQNSTNSKISLWPVVIVTSQRILLTTPLDGRKEARTEPTSRPVSKGGLGILRGAYLALSPGSRPAQGSC